MVRISSWDVDSNSDTGHAASDKMYWIASRDACCIANVTSFSIRTSAGTTGVCSTYTIWQVTKNNATAQKNINVYGVRPVVRVSKSDVNVKQ